MKRFIELSYVEQTGLAIKQLHDTKPDSMIFSSDYTSTLTETIDKVSARSFALILIQLPIYIYLAASTIAINMDLTIYGMKIVTFNGLRCFMLLGLTSLGLGAQLLGSANQRRITILKCIYKQLYNEKEFQIISQSIPDAFYITLPTSWMLDKLELARKIRPLPTFSLLLALIAVLGFVVFGLEIQVSIWKSVILETGLGRNIQTLSLSISLAFSLLNALSLFQQSPRAIFRIVDQP